MSWLEYLLVFGVLVILHMIVFSYLMKKPKKSIRNRHVVVTGGSSGIGLHIAIEAAKAGANVTIVARNINLLEKAIKVIETYHRQNESQKFNFKAIDLAEDADKINKLFDEIVNDFGEIYMLVNCAGLAICGPVEQLTPEDDKKMMNINFFGTLYPTKYVLGKMKLAGDGIIVMTASQAAMVGIYGLGSYSASKFALRGLAESVAMEVNHRNVSVTLALPPDTDTPGYKTENLSKPEITKIISGSAGLVKPEAVAAQIMHDALSGNFFSIYGTESWLITILCSGLAPWNGIIFTVLCAMVIGPLRLVGSFIQLHFRYIIRANDKPQPKTIKSE